MSDVRTIDPIVPKVPSFEMPQLPADPLGPLAAGNIRVEVTEYEDGSVDIAIGDPPKDNLDGAALEFDDNLVEEFDSERLAQDLLEGIEADIQSRIDWISTYDKGLPMLGLKPETSSTGSRKNMSTARHPLLLHSVIKGQALARGELLPATGPVKVKLDGEPTQGQKQKAEDLELDMNHFFTVTASEYYPDTDRGLFYLYYGGVIFKKVYRCPLRDRPVSECVYVPDLIISNDITDLHNARRATHRISMPKRDLKRLQDKGFYADKPITQPVSQPTTTQTAVAKVSGIAAVVQRPEDVDHTIYECYAFVNPTDYGFDEDGDEELPYIVTIEKDSKVCLGIRRFWGEEDGLKRKRRRFVKYGLVPGMGYLDYGYVHILGGYTRALTALLRLMIDAGTFANFPGGLRVKGSRLESNDIMAGPGQFPEVETGGMPISDAIMALPFKGPTADLLAMFQGIEEQGQSLAGVVTIEVGEGKTNIPVGTIMAQIEQQTQFMSAVHKRNHASQQEEFSLVKELLAEQPEILSQRKAFPVRKWTREELLEADLVPASDPNVPAHVHRIMQAVAVEQLFTAHPEYYQGRNVQGFLLDIARLGNKDELLAPILPQQPDNSGDMMAQMAMMQGQVDFFKAMLTAQGKARELMLKEREMGLKHQLDVLDLRRQSAADKMTAEEKAADRQSRETIAQMANEVKLLLEQMKQAATAQESDRQAQLTMQKDEADREMTREQSERDKALTREQADREDRRADTTGEREERLADTAGDREERLAEADGKRQEKLAATKAKEQAAKPKTARLKSPKPAPGGKK